MSASTVIKLGGSLLDFEDMRERLKGLLADFSRPRPVVLCGGGATVDIIRQWDRSYDLGEEASHWIAVRALTLNALLVERIVPGVEHVESVEALEAVWKRGKAPLLDAYRFLKDVDERSGDPLPRRWRVTSDSIAARMARTLGAPEILLLKSASVPEGTTIEEAARRGIVDPHFPTAAQGLGRVALINLREEPLEEVELRFP